jgi:hypothetical protein
VIRTIVRDITADFTEVGNMYLVRQPVMTEQEAADLFSSTRELLQGCGRRGRVIVEVIVMDEIMKAMILIIREISQRSITPYHQGALKLAT